MFKKILFSLIFLGISLFSIQVSATSGTYTFDNGTYYVSIYVPSDNGHSENAWYLRHSIFPSAISGHENTSSVFNYTAGCGNTYTFTVLHWSTALPTNLTHTCSSNGNSVTISWTRASGTTGSWPRLKALTSSQCSGITGDITGWTLASDNGCYKDNTTGTSFTVPTIADEEYDFWVHNGIDGIVGNAIHLYFNCPSPVLTVECSANPSSAILNTPPVEIKWVATSTGGTGLYTYSWVGNNGYPSDQNWTVLAISNLNSISVPYYSTGIKYATTTVTSGNQTAVLACPGSITGSGTSTGTGGGVEINESYSGTCANATEDQDYMPNTWCYAPSELDSWHSLSGTEDGPWEWNCLGSNSIITTDDALDCSASLKDVVIDPSLNCRLSASSTVNINTNTTWTATSTTHKNWSGYTKKWTVDGVDEPESLDTLNKIFTTTGVKKVDLTVASSNPRYRGNTCTTTTTVIQVGKLEEN